MDTATHFAMGFGLAGLAHLDPAVAGSPGLAEAVMLGTVIGSQAPDLDGLTRLRGSAAYVRHHRGISHSIPALFCWTAATFAVVQWILPQEHWGHLLAWIFLAVCLHVTVDLFNSYGTQGLSPFSRRWIAFHTVFIFDPFIFILHLLGFTAWLAGANPGSLFLLIYLVIGGYYVWRCLVHKRTKQALEQTLGIKGEYTLLPTLYWNQWTFVIETDTHWYVGEMTGNEPIILDTFHRKPEDDVIRAAKADEKVQAFLSFTRYAHVEVKEQPFGHEVRWMDLRYRARGSGKSHYMFVSVVCLDKERNIRSSFVGWIHRGEEQLAKKLELEKIMQLN